MAVAVDVAVGVGVAVGVEQIQSVSDEQDAFLQNPLVAPVAIEQKRSDGQSILVVQVVLHSGTGVGVGVTVGVGLGVWMVKVNESEQAPGVAVGVGVTSWARGKLDGTLGATGCCLS